jgi:mono/diheme cytochrome c family protein
LNYPIWDLQAPGLLIAVVAILHVFVSHFAVGGGLFLVVAESRARRDRDAAFLGYVRRLSRFFVLLTLVFGAITGVGIWFAITLVHPAGTSSLINTFVWGWAIEWTFFVAEVAAALIYYYGWDRLSARSHLAVGWIYFAAAFLSLVVINGILSYMLTPGDWIRTRGFWDGFFNPTYWPSLAARSFAAAGLAGIYAIFTAACFGDAALRRKVSRFAGLGWVLPMAVALPLSLAWYFAAAEKAGVHLEEIFGARGSGLGSILGASFGPAAGSGYPFALRAVRVAVLAMAACLLGTLYVVFLRRERYGRPSGWALMICGLLALGGAEWVREGIRKPFLIGGYMFVNGVRVPGGTSATGPPGQQTDAFSLDALGRTGVLDASPWVRLGGASRAATNAAAGGNRGEAIDHAARAGGEVFRLECSVCHSLDGYNAIRPLVRGRSSATLEGIVRRLAEPSGDGSAGDWSGAGLRVKTWRGRRMPPFAGTDAEARALSIYLARLGGGAIDSPAAESPAASAGARIFEANCAACHGEGTDWPMQGLLRGRSADRLYDLIGRLPELSPDMPPFEGTDEERRALAEYLAGSTADPAQR